MEIWKKDKEEMYKLNYKNDGKAYIRTRIRIDVKMLDAGPDPHRDQIGSKRSAYSITV